MILKKKPKNTINAKNMIVQVTGFVKGENDEVGVTGKDLTTNQEVTVFLTDKGKAAENENRNSLKKLQDGYKIQKTQYKLVNGGIVAFKDAFFHDEKGSYLSAWPNVLAHNPEDAKNYVGHAKLATLRIFTPSDKNPSGFLCVYDGNPENHVVSNAPDQHMFEAIKALLTEKNYQSPGFLVRKLDAAGTVIDYQEIKKNYNTDAGRPMTPVEQATYVRETIKDLAGPETSYNLLPTEKITVSTKALMPDAKGDSQLTSFKAIEKAYYKDVDGDRDILAKETWFKVGGDNNEFVNNVYPLDKFGSGFDPCLIGGLKYSDQVMSASEDDSDHSQVPDSSVYQETETDQHAPGFGGPGM